MSGQNSVTLRAVGLYTYPNPLGSVPEGSLLEAKNIVIDRNQVMEPRRGYKQYGNTFGISTDRTKQISTYKDVVLRHVLSNLQYDSNNNGTFVDFNNANNISEVEPGLRLKSIEINGNYYFTTLNGIKKLSAQIASDFTNIAVESAGAPKALDVIAKPDFTSTGFLTANSKTAYRIVWGHYDKNENLLLGAPSSRAVVYNSTATSSNTNLKFSIPNDVNSTGYFYQIYRTGVFTQSPTEIDPGEEFQLVFQQNVTTSDILLGFVVSVDITPEEFRKQGTFLYTNPNSGFGIESANDKPPFAKDIQVYKGYTFYANTKTVQRLNFSFLSVSQLGPSNTKFINISDGVTNINYYFQGSFESYLANFTTTNFSDLYNPTLIATAKYFTINSSSDETKYLVWYYKSTNDIQPNISGFVNIKIDISTSLTLSDAINATATQISSYTNDFNITRSSNTLNIKCANNGFVNIFPITTINSFTIVKDNLGTGQDASNFKIFLPRIATGLPGDLNGPTTAQQLEQVARSLINVINLKDTLVSAYYTSTFDSVPGQILLEQRNTTGSSFFLNSNAGNEFNPTIPIFGNLVSSTNEISPNRIYFSKFQQPEAVPLSSFIDIGPKDRAIKRILALRDSLLIIKEEGIYRLSGQVSQGFTVALFDTSAQILAADSAVILNNQVYFWSIQGIAQVTDSQVNIISQAIENKLLFTFSQNPYYATASFGVSYESDRSYFLWLPTTANDIVATQALRFNTFRNAWVEWTNSATCGHVNFGNDKMYLGAGDINIIEEERKSLTRTDYADREYIKSIQLNGVIDNIIKLSSTTNIEIDDILLQTQYLTGSEFNSILRKLDLDSQVIDNNYYSILKYITSSDMRLSLTNLASKLDLDSGVNDTNYLQSIQSETNTIISTSLGPLLTLNLNQPNTILPGRYIQITGSNSVPNIDGQYYVVSSTPTSVTINKSISSISTSGLISTLVNDFKDMQSSFNIIVNKLNNDIGVFYSDYMISDKTVEFELPIYDFNIINNTVTIPVQQNLLFGPITLFKAIKTKITWNQVYFGDPTVEKQVRESKILFENTNFSKMKLSFATDRSPNFEGNIYTGMGIGDFGQFIFGEVNFGGVSAPLPLRDYVPRDKQRCTFIFVRIEHGSAREKFSIFGMSLNYRPYNIRITK